MKPTADEIEPNGPSAARGRRFTWSLVFAVFVVVCLSRAVVFPASIWEQDEAYFAAAVIAIDLNDSAPHPPFFPLWIGIGKLGRLLGFDPASSLQMASAILGSLMLLPLVALWSRFMKPALAISASVLGLAAPGVWMLSGRAFSGTAATAMLVTVLVCWTRTSPDRRWLAAGSFAAGLAILIRPHFGLVLVVVVVVMLIRLEQRFRIWVVVPAALVTVLGGAAFVVVSGGPATVVDAVSQHAALHFGALPTASRGLLGSGLARVLGHPVTTVIWCGFAAWGAWGMLRQAKPPAAGLPVVVALVSVLVLVFGLSNPAHPRYAVPIVILSCGFVVMGLGRVLNERWTLVATAAAVTGAAAVVLPAATTYRQVESPPLRALARADRLASQREGVVVADRTLHSFVLYREAMGSSSAPVVFDHLLDFGAGPPAPAARTVMVFDAGHQSLLLSSEGRQTYSCGQGLLRRLAQDRFLDVTVADGATIEGGSSRAAPDFVQ